MTLEHDLGGWTLGGVREKAKRSAAKPKPRPRRRLHADWLLELSMMLLLAALLPRGGGRQ